MAELTFDRESFPRRELPRHSASITASYRANGKSYVGTIVNMSVTGAMIMGCQPISPNSFISINIPQVGTVSAEVVWNNGEALGICFETPRSHTNQTEQALSRLVNGLPEEEDRRLKNQYSLPTAH